MGGKGCVVGVVGGNRNKDKHAKGDKKEKGRGTTKYFNQFEKIRSFV